MYRCTHCAETYTPFLTEQLQVQVDEVQVGLGGGVVPPTQLRVVPVAGFSHAGMDDHTHVG